MKSTRCWVIGYDCDKKKYRPSWYSRRLAKQEGLETFEIFFFCLKRSAEMNIKSNPSVKLEIQIKK